MFYFTWEPSFETGIDIIDSQHKRIVDYINALHEAMNAKQPAKVEEVLDQLVDYTITHFTFEESLMEKAGYLHFEAHKKVHEAFTNRILEYKQRYAAGEDVSKKLLSDLRIWLTNHIKQEDKNYVPDVQAGMKKIEKGWLSKTLSKFFG